ncbi:hypothetical protein C0989_004860 [Termitomyces sp. Mn162]|nr:hypothetical protein C0989_004860 [Termitomyces sp. Mn162]
MASSILRNLNPVRGLFNQSAAHTLALFARPQASSIPGAFQTWDQPAIPKPHSQWPPSCIDDNNQTLSYIDEPGNSANKHAPCNGPPRDQPPHFNLLAPHPTGPGAPRPPFLTNHPYPPPASVPNPPADANYFGPPTLGGPPQWASGPAPGNAGQPPGRGPPNSGPSGGWGPVMDNFPLQHGNGNNYYYYYNAGPLL